MLNRHIEDALLVGLGIDNKQSAFGINIAHKLPHVINNIKDVLYSKLDVVRYKPKEKPKNYFAPEPHACIHGSRLDLLYRYFNVTRHSRFNSGDECGEYKLVDPFKGLFNMYEVYDCKTMEYLARFDWVSEQDYFDAVFENINNYDIYNYRGEYEIVKLSIGYNHTRELLIKPNTTIPFNKEFVNPDYELQQVLKTKKGKSMFSILVLSGVEELITFIKNKQLKVA